MKKILLLLLPILLIVGCEEEATITGAILNEETIQENRDSLIGDWCGMQKELFTIDESDTTLLMVDTTITQWFFSNNMLHIRNRSSVSFDSLTTFYTIPYQTFDDTLIIDIGIIDENNRSSWIYNIEENNLYLYSNKNRTSNYELTILKFSSIYNPEICGYNN